jgi:transposase InsO family protein
VLHVMKHFDVSERRICRVLNQPRSTQRYVRKVRDGEALLIKRMIELATKYGRYGYRRITALLQREGFQVNHKRVERLWRNEGLKVPQKQPKRKRLWFNDGSCIRLRPQFKDHVWSYDFVATRTEDGRPLRTLTLIDELLNGEIFITLLEAKVLNENWRKEYNQFRPHSSLNYQPPAPKTIMPKVEILT